MGFFLIWQFIFIFLNQYISYAVYVQSAGEDNYIFEVTLNKKGLSLSFFQNLLHGAWSQSMVLLSGLRSDEIIYGHESSTALQNSHDSHMACKAIQLYRVWTPSVFERWEGWVTRESVVQRGKIKWLQIQPSFQRKILLDKYSTPLSGLHFFSFFIHLNDDHNYRSKVHRKAKTA